MQINFISEKTIFPLVLLMVFIMQQVIITYLYQGVKFWPCYSSSHPASLQICNSLLCLKLNFFFGYFDFLFEPFFLLLAEKRIQSIKQVFKSTLVRFNCVKELFLEFMHTCLFFETKSLKALNCSFKETLLTMGIGTGNGDSFLDFFD